MRTVALEQLLESLSRPVYTPRRDARVSIATEPTPFVPPTLTAASLEGERSAFQAEVILISAAAAVGKSTLARFISAKAGLPLLDLATTPVSTHSLVGMIQADFDGPGGPLDAFHRAELPIVIDALDEGRLLTGEKGFEQFLLTTAELLLRDRSVTSRPKLIFLGRTGSSAFAALALSYFGEHFVADFEIDFFDEASARRVIECYGATDTASDQNLHTSEPAQRVIDAYFHAIERALSLPKSNLWADSVGRAFAGYAPVLATLGDALAGETNFLVLENRLRKTSSTQGDAWSVIAEVIGQMLAREGAQLRAKFPPEAQGAISGVVYDSDEQLGFLARWLSKSPIRGTGSRPLKGQLAETYYSLVEQKLPEHPFVDAEKRCPRNAVFAAAILAYGISRGLELGTEADELFEEAARQPFLWRFFETGLSADNLIDGRVLGYLLASHWTDPLATATRVSLEASTAESVKVTLDAPIPLSFDVTIPVQLYGFVRGVDAAVDGELVLRGASAHRSRSVFAFSGRNVLKTTRLTVDADEVVVDGYTWLTATESHQVRRLQLQVKPQARYGWGGVLPSTYPWSEYRNIVVDPHAEAPADRISRIVTAFVQHMGQLPKPFYVATNYGALDAQEYGERATWMSRDFGPELPRFVRSLVEHGLASAEQISGQKASRLRISLKCSWDELLTAAKNPEVATAQMRAVIADVNAASGRLGDSQHGLA